MKHRVLSIGLGLATLLLTPNFSTAAVTVQGWWHWGEAAAIQADSTTNAHNFLAAFTNPNTAPGPTRSSETVAGPLGNTGYISTNSTRFGLNGGASQFWNTGYTPPPTNYGIEIWILAQNKGLVGGSITWLFSSGGGIFGLGAAGGAVARIYDNFDGTSSIVPGVVTGPNSTQVADFPGVAVTVDTNRWMHLAFVNDAGVLSFYTNGVLCATNSTGTTTDPAGAMFIGTDGGYFAFDGFIDEERVFTFAPGQFTTNDFLLRSLPSLISQPQNTVVWNGGAASFDARASHDPANTYQWKRSGTNMPGETSATLYLPLVSLADSGSVFSCVVSNGAAFVTTSNATLTVVPVQAANALAYRTAVTNEPGAVAYFPVDGNTGSTLANLLDNSHNGTLEAGAKYDGQTNRAFGERALFLRRNGAVHVPSDSAYEFGSGNGTIEALVYLAPSDTVGSATLFSVSSEDGAGIRYQVAASADGNSLIYTNDSLVQLSWSVPVSLLNRLAHVAVVFSDTTNVTAYVDGLSLGARAQSSFGSATGVPAWIGASSGTNALWSGTLDELAVYSSALSANTIAIHNSKFVFGTNTSAPIILSQSGSATLLAGGSPVLSVSASGTAPLAYQWKTNGTPIAGATSATLTLAHTTTNSSATYSVTISNPFGSTNSQPIILTFVPPPNGYAAAVMNDNPSAYWRLAESTGTNLVDSAGGRNGSYLGAFTLGASGAISGDANTAATFSGGNGEVPFSSVLNPSGPFTLEFWAKPTANATYTVASSQLRSGASRFGFIVYQNNGGPGWTVQMGNSAGVTVQIIGVTPVAPGNWYHGALVYDGGPNVTLYTFGYVDGTANNAGNGNFVPNPSAPFEIGVRNQGAFPYNGTLDEVAFYNYALTQAQLQNHVSIGLPLKLSITRSTAVVADSKPGLPQYDGRDLGPTWQASNSDGIASRNGVAQFNSTNNTQITCFGYPDFDAVQGTIMFWMRSAGTVTASGNEGAMIFDRRADNGGGGIVFIQRDDGRLQAQARNGYINASSTVTVSDNKWHHVAITYDSSVSGGVTVYIDGVVDFSAFNTADWTWQPGQELELGRSHDGYWRSFNGLLDDVRLYNRQLTGGEVASVYTTDALIDSAALTLRYNFDGPLNGYAVTWPYGSVQSAPLVQGAYTTMTNITSPFPVAPRAGVPKFFRGLH